MKSKVVLVAVACLVATAAAQAPWGGETQRSRAEVYALEGLRALGCGGGCLGVGALVAITTLLEASGPVEPFMGEAIVAGTVVLVTAAALPAAAGCGAAMAGKMLGEDGSQALAVGGAYLGTAVGAGLVALGVGVSRSEAVRAPFYVLGGLFIPAGAVVGYNLGAPPLASEVGSSRRASRWRVSSCLTTPWSAG